MSHRTITAIITTALLGSACSDWGFSPFRRDPCRRDPAACLPDDAPRTCSGEAAAAAAITELVCPRLASKWEAELFWEERVEFTRVPRVASVIPPIDGSDESVVLINAGELDRISDTEFRLYGRGGSDGTRRHLLTVNDEPAWDRPQVDADGVTWFISHFRERDGEWLISTDGRQEPLAERPEGTIPRNSSFSGDFSGNGHLDLWHFEHMYDHQGQLRFEARTERKDGHQPWPEPLAAIADVTGDGRREYLFSDGFIRQDGHYACRSPNAVSHFAIVDIDHDGTPEVLSLNQKFEETPRILSILDGDCRVLRSAVLDDILPPNTRLPTPWGPGLFAIAPVLEKDQAAFVLDVRYRAEGEDGPWRKKFLLLDQNLNVVQMFEGPQGPLPPFVDLDGDGVYEWLHQPVHEGVSTERGLWVYDFRTGDSAQLIDAAGLGTGLYQYRFADIDGDGRGEIVLVVRDDDGEQYIRAYKGAGPGFAAARRFDIVTSPPYLHNPDGTPSQEPVRYDRLGLYNAVPTGGWWAAVDADLRVRFTDVCTDDCPEGWLTYTVQVGNHGHGDVGADVLVRVYGERGSERTLLSEQRYRDVNAGRWNAADPVAVSYQGEPFDRLRAVVEPDGWESQECDKTNNEVVWNLDCR